MAGVYRPRHPERTALYRVFFQSFEHFLADLVRKELVSPEWAERLLRWRHMGFNIHSRVRAKTKTEAERVEKCFLPPRLSCP